jgi:hypothetical protein
LSLPSGVMKPNPRSVTRAIVPFILFFRLFFNQNLLHLPAISFHKVWLQEENCFVPVLKHICINTQAMWKN